jgi:hypothetical protein
VLGSTGIRPVSTCRRFVHSYGHLHLYPTVGHLLRTALGVPDDIATRVEALLNQGTNYRPLAVTHLTETHRAQAVNCSVPKTSSYSSMINIHTYISSRYVISLHITLMFSCVRLMTDSRKQLLPKTLITQVTREDSNSS